MKELYEGRGPVYIDCRHLSSEDLQHLKKTLGYDKDTLPDFIEQKGVDLGKDLLEIVPSEGMQAGPAEVCGSGILNDEQPASTVPGLFAAGDCSDQMRCVHICTTGGYLAGKRAAEYVMGSGKELKLSSSQVRALKKKAFAPMRISGALSYRKVEDTLRKMLWQNAGPARNEKSLGVALEKLDNLGQYAKEIRAKNYHELMRAHETRQMLEVAKMMCTAALARKETRFGVFHHRTDYPESVEAYEGQIILWQEEGGMNTAFSWRSTASPNSSYSPLLMISYKTEKSLFLSFRRMPESGILESLRMPWTPVFTGVTTYQEPSLQALCS